jgi:predicted dehydrogenase
MIQIMVLGACGEWGRQHCDILIPKAVRGEIKLYLIDTEASPAAHGENTIYLNWNTDAASIAQLDDIDVVIVCTPDALHVPMTQAFFGRCHALYVEKPLCLHSEDLSAFQSLLLSPVT